MIARIGLFAAALLLGGCATLAPHVPLASASAADRECLAWLARLDVAVQSAGVRDAEDDRIDGFPWLRINRPLAAAAALARNSEAAFGAWVGHLSSQDQTARAVELGNLPSQALSPDEARSAPERLQGCAQSLNATLTHDAVARAALLDRARVPDRYSTLSRAAGLYPVTRLPFFAGVQAWQREHEEAMRAAVASPRPARRAIPDGLSLNAAVEAPPLARWATDAAGLPQIGPEALQRLLAMHAPVFDIEEQGAYNRFGAPTWLGGDRVSVDASRPVVYQRAGITWFQGRALLQLVYTLWFPERPKTGKLDLLGGHLDGVIVRLTLDTDGRVLLLDTIHACGCYHMFFPAPRLRLKPDAPQDVEWAFVPAPLPALPPRSRLVVRIASATHYVLGVSSASDAVLRGSAAGIYARAMEVELRRLPLNGSEPSTRSLYAPDGLVRGTERAERFFFWPMGIASAGAMRQWGHHATAFVGRRHFDDADLIERRFKVAADD